MEAFGIFFPLLAVMTVYWLVSMVSPTLANFVCFFMIFTPVVWSLSDSFRKNDDNGHSQSQNTSVQVVRQSTVLA